MKYIIDTDIGDDIDDAFALDLALKSGLDLVCVTTVFRNTPERAQIVKRMCALYGADIPVYAGYGDTLVGGMNTTGRLCQWTPELQGYVPESTKAAEAVDAILRAARLYGQELIILALGPLTNLARAIKADSAAMCSIGGIVMMGGDYTNHYAEWNICCDVEAANIVFSADIPITAFGHDITAGARLSYEEQGYVFSMEQDSYHAYLSELARLWYASKPEGWRIVLHDVLVVRYVLDPAFCTLRQAPVAIETQGIHTRGMTVNLTRMDDYRPGDGEIISYVTALDMREFIARFMRSIGYPEQNMRRFVPNRGEPAKTIHTREEVS